MDSSSEEKHQKKASGMVTRKKNNRKSIARKKKTRKSIARVSGPVNDWHADVADDVISQVPSQELCTHTKMG